MKDNHEIFQPGKSLSGRSSNKKPSGGSVQAPEGIMTQIGSNSAQGQNHRKNKALGHLRRAIMQTARTVPAREASLRLGQLIKSARDGLFEVPPHGLGKAHQNGMILARRLEAVTTEGVIGLFEAAQVMHPAMKDQMAVIAVGGYGRGYLAPFSDIDLLILHSPRAGEKIKEGLNFILYALFDAGLMVSQAVHTPAGAAGFIKADLNGLTSFLDARFLCGNEKFAQDFQNRYENIRKGTVSNFVKAKLGERDARYKTSSASRYVVEPDIKEGKGGLRDVHLLHWLMKYTSGTVDLQPHELARATLGEEAKAYLRAADFLWSVRIQLHLIRQRGDEKLSFEVQPEIARRLGYKSRGTTRAVERFMKYYFLNLRQIGHLTGIVSARLEEANVKESRGVIGLLGLGEKRPGKSTLIVPEGAGEAFSNIALKGGRLDFKDYEKAQSTLADLFLIYQVQGLNPSYDIHPDSLKIIEQGSTFLNKERRSSSEIARIFAVFLTQSLQIEKPLRNMSQAGLLGGYIRSFGLLVGQVEYGLFRRYSLDEHIIKSIGLLNRIYKGEEKETYPVATKILQDATSVLPFFLMVLLHETGAATHESNVKRVRANVKRAIARFSELTDECDRISKVAANPHLMSHAATLRNPLSPSLVSYFCANVGDRATLDMYLVLSAVNARVAGVGSWDRRAGRDVVVLYGAARAYFEGGVSLLQANIDALIKNKQDATARLLKGWSITEVNQFFSRLTSGFWVGLEPEAAARFCIAARGVDRVGDQSASILAEVPGELYEIITYAPDRPGLFADIAGTISEIGATVHAAYAFPVAPNEQDAILMASNMFIFKLGVGVTLKDVQETLDAKLAYRLTARKRKKITPSVRFGDRRSDFEVTSKVTTDLISSGGCTVFEVEGLDRQGLLYELADALTGMGIRLQSAYVSTFGERVVDSFYIQDKNARKITDVALLQDISACLMTVMDHA